MGFRTTAPYAALQKSSVKQFTVLEIFGLRCRGDPHLIASRVAHRDKIPGVGPFPRSSSRDGLRAGEGLSPEVSDFDERRRAAVFERSRTQRVETENPRGHICDAEQLKLSERDSLRVLELLENPPPAPARLVRAAKAGFTLP
jgi:hypothetical protein